MKQNSGIGFAAKGRLGLCVGVSAFALALGAPAWAQDAASDAGEAQAGAGAASAPDIIVTGIRGSLANAQSIKQSSPTIVDAITAQDIGALPDRSVVESLQRIPGVTISKFQGGNDPAHFSAEGTTIQIRGLSQIQTLVNGRETFTAGFGRTINLADYPSELVNSIEVFKQATADMVEGGLGGSVNINTRKPLDNKGFHVAFDVEANYSDLRKKWTPVASFLVSNSWDTEIGTIGLLGSYSYSNLAVRTDSIQATNFQTRDGLTTSSGVLRNRLPGKDVAFAPIGADWRTQNTDRKRYGMALAAQWESPDRTMMLTGQFLRTLATRSWTEHIFSTESGLAEYNTYPQGCLPSGDGSANCPAGSYADYQYDANNVFQKGFITLPGTGWRSATSGQPDSPTPTGGMQQNLSRRDRDERAVTTDYSLNYRWDVSPRVHLNLDGQYVRSSSKAFDFTSYTDTFADQFLDLTGSLPVATLHKPTNGISNPATAAQTDAEYFADPSHYFYRAAMDHMDESKGREWAFRADVTYDIDNDIPFLEKIRIGGRYSDRSQTVKYSPYNWGYVSEIWSGAGEAVYLDQFGQQQSELFKYDDFFRGKLAAPQGWFYAGHQLKNYKEASAFFQQVNQVWQQNGGFGGGWTPLASRAGVIDGSPYLPGEISSSSEKTKAAYVMLDFGSPEPVFGDVEVHGNIGLRYVETRDASGGAVTFPANTLGGTYAQTCLTGGTVPAICSRGQQFYDDLVTFSNAASVASDVKNRYHNWLPSFNLIVSPTRSLQVRFAYAHQVQRPDFGFLRNYVNLSVNTGEVPVTASAGNPFLKPALSKQWDIGIGWYFSKVGSITFDYFQKKVHDFFYQSTVQRAFTNNGVTQTAFLLAPANFDGVGTIKGFEVGYQQIFDFLPGPLAGLGAGATYTRVKSSGIPNSLLSNVSDAPAAEPSTGRGNLPFEGLSKHNVNLTAFYERGPVSARIAYTWRSKHLQTAVDQLYPYFPVYLEGAGQLDASFFFNLTDRIKVGVQGMNLTNTVTKTRQQFTASGMQAPLSYFVTDRRYALIVRGAF